MFNILILCFISIANLNGGIGGMSLGYNHQSGIYSINNTISNYTTPFKENYFASGGYGWAIIHGFIIGGGGMSTHDISTSNTTQFEITYTTGGFQTGIITPVKKIYSAVTIGMGMSGYTMKIIPLSNITTYEDILNNPEKFSIMSLISKNVSIGIHLLIPCIKSVYIGISGIYYFALSDSNWQFENGSPVSNGPTVKPLSYYLSFNIFFGNIEKGVKNGGE